MSLLYVLFLIIYFNYFVLDGISEMLVEGRDRVLGGVGEKQKAVQILQADSQSHWKGKTQGGLGLDAGCYDKHTNTRQIFKTVYYSKGGNAARREQSDYDLQGYRPSLVDFPPFLFSIMGWILS